MSASCGAICGGRRQLATGGSIDSVGAGRSCHFVSNTSAVSGGGVLRRDRSANKRLCRFGPYSKVDLNDSRTQYTYDNPKRPIMGEHVTTPVDFNIRITNMHYEVNATDLKSVTVYYDRYGRTLETADVVFYSKNAALNAVFQWQPINLELTTVSSTVANHAVTIPHRVIHFGDDHGTQGNRGNTTEVRGNSKRCGGRGQRKTKRKIPSKEELDAQLDCIMNNIK